ncbi:MAG: HPr family phosphocarrier protein [Clostridia bacterium]|nr:HPr family phosphocarrier protein [Clostridia bacterium]
MKEMIIRLVSIEDVKSFVNVAVTSPCEIYLISGRYIVDGKSIMGVFSLDLSNNIRLEVQGESAAETIEKFRAFEAK